MNLTLTQRYHSITETSDSDALKCQQKDIEQRIQDDHGYAAADPSDTTVDVSIFPNPENSFTSNLKFISIYIKG